MLVLTHTPLHSVCPAGQRHMPLWQLVPPMQGVPQVPQLALSLCRLRQVADEPVPQSVCPDGQAQVLDWQVRPLVQTVPQAPQLLASTRVSRHWPLQKVCPLGQVFWQTPATQAWPVVHTLPQAPQLALSVWRF